MPHILLKEVDLHKLIYFLLNSVHSFEFIASIMLYHEQNDEMQSLP